MAVLDQIKTVKKPIIITEFPGVFNAAEFLEVSPQARVIYDFKDTDFTQQNFADFDKITYGLISNHQCQNSQIAFHCPSDLQFGIGRTLQTLIELRTASIVVEVFREYEKAVDWFNE